MKFIHTADWHPHSMGTIGGKLAIDPTTGLSYSLTDFQKSLDFLAEVIHGEEVKLLLIAGDLFDSNKPSMDEIRVVMEFLEAQTEAGCAVVIIPGNHDIAQSSSLSSSLTPLRFMNVHIIEQPGQFLLDVFQGGEIPRNWRVRVDCLPYPSRGRLIAALHNDAKKATTPEELTAIINRGLLSILQNFTIQDAEADVKILMAHGSVENAVVGEQPRTLAHDVSIPIHDVEQHYDYVALGHIHKFQQVGSRGYYSGSLLRQSFGEEHEKKGFILGEYTESGVKAKYIENPQARLYRTLKHTELDPTGLGVGTVYRIKDSIPEDAVPMVMPLVQRFTQALPFVQVDLAVRKEDRTRDAQLNNSLSSSEALERCLERDGVTEPQLSLCRELHLTLMEEGTRR